MESRPNEVHCLKCIREEKITLFPINITRGVRTGKLPESHQIIIDLICTCNLPIYAYVDQRESSVRYTVQCDVCGNWFHNECVGLPERSTIDNSFNCYCADYSIVAQY